MLKTPALQYLCLYVTRMSSGTGSWPGCELCWPQEETPSTAWTPRPPPPTPLPPPPVLSPPLPHLLWPTDTPPTYPVAALLRSSLKDSLTTSPRRWLRLTKILIHNKFVLIHAQRLPWPFPAQKYRCHFLSFVLKLLLVNVWTTTH